MKPYIENSSANGQPPRSNVAFLSDCSVRYPEIP